MVENPMIDIFDATPVWVLNPENRSFFIPLGTQIQPEIGIENKGNVPLTEIQLFVTVLDQFGGVLNSVNQTIDSLATGETQVLTLSENISLNQTGNLTVTTQLVNSQDINIGNDLKSNKIIVIDTTLEEIKLGYVNGTFAPPATLSWLSSTNYNNGGAIYIEPPLFPIDIKAIEYYLFDVNPIGFSNGFQAQILADDGINGAPGTVLFEKNIPANTLNATAWLSVPLDENLKITEGGVYFAWRTEGVDIGLGVDNTAAAFSGQNWELLNNVWGRYRGANNQDFYIRAVASPTQNSTAVTEELLEKYGIAVYPNPLQNDLILEITLPQKEVISWSIFHANGQQVLTMEKELVTGKQVLQWNNIKQQLPAGSYFYQLQIGTDLIVDKLVKF